MLIFSPIMGLKLLTQTARYLFVKELAESSMPLLSMKDFCAEIAVSIVRLK